MRHILILLASLSFVIGIYHHSQHNAVEDTSYQLSAIYFVVFASYIQQDKIK